ncbi:PREDICTED: uncharacterized protein LOC109471461 isoform X2 [Branchiostoma belcheri]|uniref:Uncharacterized protein LOC109471461 isoform X2 n=1 Tax=Branchiostoma belcheri TaxID=7741 RepID=A0A6P4Z9M8_BRABE|nr:PREDICTED: uncharacterized protein LOC109471461 isoform X2 [Branchiostoma belcheri]
MATARDRSSSSESLEEPTPLPGDGLGKGEGEGSVDSFFLRQQRERFSELRRISHGERPVSGQGICEKLDSFFRGQIGADSAELGEENDENRPTSSQRRTEERRPEAVRLEVRGLFDQHRVSNVLQSDLFRRELENVVRGGLSRFHRSVPPPRLPPPPPPQDFNDASSTTTATDFDETGSVSSFTSGSTSDVSLHSWLWQVPPPPPQSDYGPPQMGPGALPPPPSYQAAQHAQPWQQQAPGQLGQQGPWQQQQGPWQQQQGPWQQQQAQQGHRQQPWLQQRQPTLLQRQQQQQASRRALYDIEQAQRENIVNDISELLQRQLVSSSLDGGFRGVLELMVARRVNESGTDGERVQESIQSIPRSRPHRRNDFSHLGINTQPQGAEADGIGAPRNQLQGPELASLQAQVEELKNMVRVSFDLQLDLQRAIRQEVAAAMAAHTGSNTQDVPVTRAVREGHCLICLDQTVDSVLYQCGHMCVCNGCGLNLKAQGHNCPVCRAPIRDVIRAYRCNQD